MPGPGGSRAAQKMEDKLTMTPEDFDKTRGFEDALPITDNKVLKQLKRERNLEKENNEKLSNQRSGYF